VCRHALPLQFHTAVVAPPVSLARLPDITSTWIAVVHAHLGLLPVPVVAAVVVAAAAA